MILFHCWEEFSSKKADLKGCSALLDTINFLEVAERKGVHHAYYPSFTTPLIITCPRHASYVCPFFFYLLNISTTVTVVCATKPSPCVRMKHAINEYGIKNRPLIKLLWDLIVHHSFLVMLLPTLSSGLIGIDVGLLFHPSRLSHLCSPAVLITTTLPPLPNLENCWCDDHGLLFLTDIGSGSVTLNVAVDKVFNQTLKETIVLVSWSWWEDEMSHCMQWTSLYFYVVGYHQALPRPRLVSIPTSFASVFSGHP